MQIAKPARSRSHTFSYDMTHEFYNKEKVRATNRVLEGGSNPSGYTEMNNLMNIKHTRRLHYEDKEERNEALCYISFKSNSPNRNHQLSIIS